MKILVAIKRVVDYHVRVRVRADGSGVDLAHAKMSINPFDEIALEEAVRLREAGAASEVLAVSCGSTTCQETLRMALALGADRALLVETDADLQPLSVAKLLKAVVAREAPQLIMLGKQAIDDDAGQTSQMLAALLGWPQATCAAQIALTGGKVSVTCEVDDGQETIEMNLPAVVSADLRLNEPRYATLPNIVKAKKKPLEVIKPLDLNVASADLVPRLLTLTASEPPKRRAGVRVADVAELVAKLKDEAKVIE